MDRIGAMPDVFRRSLLWGSLWDSVRQAELAPRDYVALAAKLLPAEPTNRWPKAFSLAPPRRCTAT